MSISRRHFLKAAAGSSALCAFGSTVPAFVVQTAQAALTGSPRQDTVVVMLQLSGGNDGLNTVVPFEDDAYHRARPTLRLEKKGLHQLDASSGLHPEMAAFHRLYQEGWLGIVQGVGYPQSNRDHDQAMRDWHTARPEQAGYATGWMGRAIDHVYHPSRADLPGVFVGQIPTPFGLRTEKAIVPSLASLEDWPHCGPAGFDGRQSGQDPAGRASNEALQFLRETAEAACAASRRLVAAAEMKLPEAGDGYPDFKLAETLRTIARLIQADVGIRIYFAELGGGGIGGFDTHANQAANHGALLRQLSESVAAFASHLRQEGLLERVLLVTFSEFGRTVAENGRRGTDHGAAAPLFLMGGKVRGGLVGIQPSLEDLEGGALRYHTDFRQVYAAVLERWLGFASEPILGRAYAPLEITS